MGYVKEMAQELKDLLMTAGGCRLPWRYHEGGCYLFVDNKKTWHDAENDCRANDGHLASVPTKATFDFLYGLTGRRWNTWVWVGGYKESGVWRWVDGSTFSVKKDGEGDSKDAIWGPDAPDNRLGKRDCVQMYSGGLFEGNCIYNQQFICQKFWGWSRLCDPAAPSKTSARKITTLPSIQLLE
ncbi:lactose-binding lectin l-2-like [Dunckerocampus dactyliophorus]|uniref:lactose-binding lectin l-2-like n=1 Tax=Dunckerocampus dactyliophorus TaxID=161453 RepID=UPI0024068576|nr:lactose-binding lectin l-2-like [Dunckerocampus dactyliophorus]XP_054630894.1 lactose-binding lectin l-2-like [Dunckerocampus dactyliophorus]